MIRRRATPSRTATLPRSAMTASPRSAPGDQSPVRPFLATLRAGHSDYIINEEALAYMRGRNLAGPLIERLVAAPHKAFADSAAWAAHLAALGVDQLAVEPNPVKIATEGAMWGAIRHHGFLGDNRGRVR